MNRAERSIAGVENPDTCAPNRDVFQLRADSVPIRLMPLLSKYAFRRCSLEEIEQSEALTNDAWPGLPETTSLDLRVRDMINAPMCGAFNADGEMVAYTRLLWGHDNLGLPEIVSHMTAVRRDVRDGGVGEALKWLARQIALEFPRYPVEQLSVTFDNLQGRNCYINFTKLGVICGAAGGALKENAYGPLTGVQHKGNPTDRFKGRWHLNSPWVIAHLHDSIQVIPLHLVRAFPSTLTIMKSESAGLIQPTALNTELETGYIALPIPLNWDELLKLDKNQGYEAANKWRTAIRVLLRTYYQKGYTTILQVPDAENGINIQVLVKDFDPFQPPADLLKEKMLDISPVKQ